MGDYYWYGCKGERNVSQAAKYYTMAAKKGDPHALFNLGFMLEEGADIPQTLLKELNINNSNDTMELLIQIYDRCKKSAKTEAYLPCSLSLYKVQIQYLWNNHGVLLQIFSMLSGVVLVIVAGAWTASQFRIREQRISDV
ncbi:hypothetical protein LSH36_576g00039 [Paralvinella palmiformis]|uniref:Uncharacterized protein n=1 Tax=Paralvinella palmiformis TaxID=53620 RepID=A0AAD9MWR7_9ANNE|nr:hypothetical protein LSH36_576g00039 [Paralvinella palmiformis]